MSDVRNSGKSEIEIGGPHRCLDKPNEVFFKGSCGAETWTHRQVLALKTSPTRVVAQS